MLDIKLKDLLNISGLGLSSHGFRRFGIIKQLCFQHRATRTNLMKLTEFATVTRIVQTSLHLAGCILYAKTYALGTLRALILVTCAAFW